MQNMKYTERSISKQNPGVEDAAGKIEPKMLYPNVMLRKIQF